MSRSDRRSHIRQQVRRLQMRSQSFTFLYHKPISCYTIFRYVFCVSLVSIFLTGSSIGISCKQVKTRFASFPLLSRQSPRSRASADFGSLSAKKAAAFSDILSRKCCCFLFLQMISFSKRSAKSEFFLHSQIQNRLHQRDPALPG